MAASGTLSFVSNDLHVYNQSPWQERRGDRAVQIFTNWYENFGTKCDTFQRKLINQNAFPKSDVANIFYKHKKKKTTGKKRASVSDSAHMTNLPDGKSTNQFERRVLGHEFEFLSPDRQGYVPDFDAFAMFAYYYQPTWPSG